MDFLLTLVIAGAVIYGIFHLAIWIFAKMLSSNGIIGDITNIIYWILRHLWKLLAALFIFAIFYSTFNSLS